MPLPAPCPHCQYSYPKDIPYTNNANERSTERLMGFIIAAGKVKTTCSSHTWDTLHCFQAIIVVSIQHRE